MSVVDQTVPTLWNVGIKSSVSVQTHHRKVVISLARYNGREISSNTYVAARVRGDAEGRPTLASLVVVAPQNCDHTHTICETAECLNSWSLDWQLYLQRTNRGRDIIQRFHLTDDQLRTLASGEFRDIRPRFDVFDRQYDRPIVRRGAAEVGNA